MKITIYGWRVNTPCMTMAIERGAIGGEGPISVFFSYAHADDEFRDDLHKALIGAEISKIIRMWWDRKIPPGAEWQLEIDARLRAANIILVLLSIDYCFSEHCQLELLAARSRKDEAVLIPVYLRPFDLKPFGWDKQQLLPGEPIQAWERDRRDEVWATVATRIRKEAEELKDKRRQATPPAWSLPDRDLSFFGRDELLDGL